MVRLVEDNLMLTLKGEVYTMTNTFNLMSTNCVPRLDGPPCKSSSSLSEGSPQAVYVHYLQDAASHLFYIHPVLIDGVQVKR